MSHPAKPLQLAGHIGAFTKLEGGRLRKPVKSKEAVFYKTLTDRKLDASITSYFPKFFGIEVHDGKGTQRHDLHS